AERMYFLQLRRRQGDRLHAAVLHDLVRRAQLLEQPQDALRARVVEMMNCQHGGPPVRRMGSGRGEACKPDGPGRAASATHSPESIGPAYSRSVGSLKRAPSLMLPWATCGNPAAVGSPGSRFEAVSSGGKRTSEARKSISAPRPAGPRRANASRDAWASPPWRRITSVRLILRPSWP